MSSTSNLNMGVSQTPGQAEQASHPDNPFVSPKGGICLIDNLPLELLSYIFTFGPTDDGVEIKSQNEDEDTRYSPLGSKMANEKDTHDHHDHQTTDVFRVAESESFHVSLPFSFVVSHVCRRWRNIALLTPSFWTTIVAILKARPPYERVSTLLKRSKNLPIDIIVASQLHSPVDIFKPPSPANVEFLLAMLISHIHRWRTMQVIVPTRQFMQEILSAVSDPSVPAASQLTSLELQNMMVYDDFPVSKHLTLFGGSAPLLTRIVLWGVHVDWDQPWIASASNLTDLVLAYHPEAVRPSFAQFSAILRNAPALEKFYLHRSGPHPAWFLEPSFPVDFDVPIQLARLTDFHLAFNGQARTTWLMRNFAFPALNNLALGFDSEDYTEFVEELARPAPSVSASQASCSWLNGLESLKIAGLHCSDECIKMLYGELQNLRSLNLSLSYLNPLFLDILSTPCTFPGRGNIWLPRLVRLYLSGTSTRTLREVVSKRREVGVPLSSLFLVEVCAVDDGDLEWFKENVKRVEVFEGSDARDDSGWNEDVNDD